MDNRLNGRQNKERSMKKKSTEQCNLEQETDLASFVLPSADRNHRLIQEIDKQCSDAPKGYRWPASRISRREMARLCVVRDLVGRPLTQLIKEACSQYADQILEQHGFPIPHSENKSSENFD